MTRTLEIGLHKELKVMHDWFLYLQAHNHPTWDKTTRLYQWNSSLSSHVQDKYTCMHAGSKIWWYYVHCHTFAVKQLWTFPVGILSNVLLQCDLQLWSEVLNTFQIVMNCCWWLYVHSQKPPVMDSPIPCIQCILSGNVINLYTFNIFSSKALVSALPNFINCCTRILDASVFPAPLSPNTCNIQLYF